MDWALAQGQIDMADTMRDAGGVFTLNYAEKLGAYHGSRPVKKTEKRYDLRYWSLVPTNFDYDNVSYVIENWGNLRGNDVVSYDHRRGFQS